MSHERIGGKHRPVSKQIKKLGLFRGSAFWFLVALGLSAVPISALSMFYAGIGWDARIDTGQSLVIRESVAGLPDTATLQEAYDIVYFTAEFYGVLLTQLGELAHLLVTGSSESLPLNDITTYRWQGLANLVLAVLAAASLAVAVSKALKSPFAGAFTWALIMTTPIYFGMSTMNIKDMPIAAGVSLISAGFVFSFASNDYCARWVIPITLVSLGSCISIATRPGLWPLILGFAMLCISLFLLVALRQGDRLRWLPSIVSVAFAVPLTLTFLWLTNPFGRRWLFTWLWDSFMVMRNYPWQGSIRTVGQDLESTDLPMWYVPTWLLAQLPVLVSLSVAAGLVITGWLMLRRRQSHFTSRILPLLPVYVQGLILPLIVVLSGATLYDGIRHVLFVVPALIVFAAVFIAYLEYSLSGRFNALARSLAVFVALAVVASSAWATARWIPYSYAFINPIAGWDKGARNWELDYWGLTAFEGVQRLHYEGLDPVGVLPTEETATLFGGSKYEEDFFKESGKATGLYVFLRGGASLGKCQEVFRIQRDGVTLGVGGTC